MKHLKKLFALVLALSLVASALCMESLAAVVDSEFYEGYEEGKYWSKTQILSHSGTRDTISAKTYWAGTGIKAVSATVIVRDDDYHSYFKKTGSNIAKADNHTASWLWTADENNVIINSKATHKVRSKDIGTTRVTR